MPAGGGWLQLPWSAVRSPDRQVHAPVSGCAGRGAPARCRRAEGIALPGLIRRLLLTLTAGALGAAVLLPAHAATAATDGACPDDDGVTVVVDFQELGGGTVVRCAPGPQASGLAALEQAGFTIEGTASWGTAVVCRIDGRPVPADEPCTGYPPVSAYWSYWQAAEGGSWGYASTGPADARPEPGGFEGWSFSKDRGPDDTPPPGADPVRPPAPTTTSSTTTTTVAPTTTTTVAPTTTTTAPVRPAAAAAAAWLAGELGDGRLPGPGGRTDWGLTIDALTGLAAAGTEPDTVARTAAVVAGNVRAYNSFDDAGVPGVRLAGPTAKLLVAAVAAGADPASFGGFDLRAETLALAGDQGRLTDAGTRDSSNTYGQALAVAGLARTGGVPAEVTGFLLRQQCAAGGFRFTMPASGSCDATAGATLDPDVTAIAVQALDAAARAGAEGAEGAAEAAAKGAAWLAARQGPDGAFGGAGPTAAANANSTGLAGQALAALGDTAAAGRAARHIETLQLTEADAGAAAADAGAIAYDPAVRRAAVTGGIAAAQRDQWRRATAQGMLALTRVGLADIGAGGPVEPGAGGPDGPGAPGAPGPGAGGTDGGGTATGSTVAGAPVAGAPVAGAPVGGAALPFTGAPTLAAGLAALLLIATGLVLRRAATRRRAGA